MKKTSQIDDEEDFESQLRRKNNSELHFIKSRWGRKCLVHNNYIYASNKRVQSTNTTYWRCTHSSSRKKNPCSARLTTRRNHITNSVDLHNHEPDMEEIYQRQEFLTDYSIDNP